jgi:MSHA biogenesis protein MshG
MPRFAYTGRGASGDVQGELDGADATAVATLLMSRVGHTAADRRQPRCRRARWCRRQLKPLALFQPKVQPADLMMFSRQLHTLLRVRRAHTAGAGSGLQESAVNQRIQASAGGMCAAAWNRASSCRCRFAQQSGVFNNFYRVHGARGRDDRPAGRRLRCACSGTSSSSMFMRQQVKSALRYPTFVMAGDDGWPSA